MKPDEPRPRIGRRIESNIGGMRDAIINGYSEATDPPCVVERMQVGHIIPNDDRRAPGKSWLCHEPFTRKPFVDVRGSQL